MKLFAWFADKENEKKVKAIGRFFKDFWPALLAGYLMFGNALGRFVTGIIGKIVIWTVKIVAKVIPDLIKELAISQDIDPDLLVNDVNDAAIFADILRGMNAQPTGQEPSPAGQQPPAMGAAGGVPPTTGPNDAAATGGSGIGIGDAPIAGEAGFTGNTG